MSDDLRGKRILVVEDEAMVAMLVEDLLEEMGCTVVGPVADVEQAIKAVRDDKIDGAILDVNLAGTSSYRIADTLAALSLPFVFITGYGEAGLDVDYRNRPVLQKPFTTRTFQQAVLKLHQP